MKTRLFTIALILILSAPLAIAQTGEKGKMSFGILGGINFQNLNGKFSSGDKLANDMLLGLPRRSECSDTHCSGVLFSTRIDVCSKRS